MTLNATSLLVKPQVAAAQFVADAAAAAPPATAMTYGAPSVKPGPAVSEPGRTGTPEQGDRVLSDKFIWHEGDIVFEMAVPKSAQAKTTSD